MQDVEFAAGLRPDGLPAALSDPRRLAAVEATGLLDTGPEEAFEDLARLAGAVTGCGRAFITLVDDHRSFWKSCVGVPPNAGRSGRVPYGTASATSWSGWPGIRSSSRTRRRIHAPVTTRRSSR